MNPFATGAFHSEREYRDAVHETLDVPIPEAFDADYSKIVVQNQHKIGICTAEAVCTLIERYRNDGIVLSRTFTYFVGKQLVDGNLSEGSAIKSMLHGAYKYGTMPASIVPDSFDEKTTYAQFINSFKLPTPNQDNSISINGVNSTKIPGYIYVDPANIKEGIYKYNGVACRYDCGATWYTSPDGYITWDANKLFPVRQPNPTVSGHAVTGKAYNQSIFTWFRNSWSDLWGMKGDGYCNYQPTECWAISSMPVTPSLPSPKTWHHIFSQDLDYGLVNNDEVRNLQTALSIMGYIDKKYITGNYWDITAQAVYSFQKDHVVTDLKTRWIVMTNRGQHCSTLTRNALNSIFG